MLPLSGKVALVTGASRGIGKGIALALGSVGATVYVTGRTEDEATATVPLPGTIHETAALVTEAGGKGIALRCDHSDDAEVQHTFEKIFSETDRLDILVNNAWAGYQAKQSSKKSGFHSAFWKLPPSHWDSMFHVGVRSHYVASIYGAAKMVEQQSGLIVHITAGAAQGYASNTAYGVSKVATNRLATDMAHELQKFNVTVVGLCPDFVATEMLMKNRIGSKLEKWMESPVFVGRAIVAVATDPERHQRTGQILRTRALAQEYGFTDLDGHQPVYKP